MILIATSTDLNDCGHSLDDVARANLIYFPTPDGAIVLKNRSGESGPINHSKLAALKKEIAAVQ